MQRELVARAQTGDVEAFTVLAGQIVDRLHGVAFHILRDSDRADDATQRALIAVWDHLRDLRDPECFEGWSYRLVVREAYREARKERSQHSSVRFIPVRDAIDDDQFRVVADRDQLERAFRRLSPDQRAVLVLHYYGGLTVAQIAEAMAIPIGTVCSRLHNATSKMRLALGVETRGVLARGHEA